MQAHDASSIGYEVMFCERVMYALTRQFVTKTVRRALERTKYSHWHSDSYGAVPCVLDRFDKTWTDLNGWGRCVLHRRAFMATTDALIMFHLSDKTTDGFDDEGLELLQRIDEVVYQTLTDVIEDSPFNSDIDEHLSSVAGEFTQVFHGEWEGHVKPIFESRKKDS